MEGEPAGDARYPFLVRGHAVAISTSLRSTWGGAEAIEHLLGWTAMAASELIAAARAYAGLRPDSVRRAFEHAFYARMLPRLLEGAGGGAVVDFGCGDGLASALAGQRLERYVRVDLCPPPAPDRASRRFTPTTCATGWGRSAAPLTTCTWPRSGWPRTCSRRSSSDCCAR